MSRDQLHVAGAVLRALVGSDALHDGAGRAVAVLTTWGFAVFAVLALVALARTRDGLRVSLWTTVALGTGSGILASGIGTVVKRIVAERRPCQVDPAAAHAVGCPPAGSWSFPSNHSVWAGACAVAVVRMAVLVRRWWIAVAALATAAGIGASRVVLGVHYWWDVLAGLALGGVVAGLVLLAGERWLRPRLAARERVAGSRTS